LIKFTLIENSLDSIELGMKHLTKANQEGDPSSYKHSLLCLFHGAELILKEILVLIDPITIFDKNSLFRYCKTPLKPTTEELYNCRSLDIAGICSELKKHYSGDFPKTSIKALQDLAKERNKVQHFAIKMNPSNILNQLLKLYLLLIKPAYKIRIEHKKSNEDEELPAGLIGERISEFENSFLNIKMEDGFHRGCCAKCGHFTFFIVYENESYPIYCACTTCNYEIKGKEGYDYFQCPECDNGSLVYDPDLKAGVCVAYKCANNLEGETVEMEPCASCSGYKIEKYCFQCDTET
jgi:predicted RNA-binding Zn-ribbon protein involved in translation (DUF1610 family)